VDHWGRSVETLKLIAEARARGIDATIDQYPYTASSTGLQALLPPWALEGGRNEVVQRLADAATRARIRAAIVDNLQHDRGGGDPKNVRIASCAWNPALAGKTLAEITRERGVPVGFEAAADSVLEIVEQGGAQAIFHAISEADLERIRATATMIA
jgi:dihydroorotase/N-acyl-D-amino-acid deacylase